MSPLLNGNTLTVEVIVQEFEQLVVLLGEVREVDEKPGSKTKCSTLCNRLKVTTFS